MSRVIKSERLVMTVLVSVLFASMLSLNSCGTCYTVTYNGNGNTGGSVPIDSTIYKEGQTVTVLGNTGNLERPGYSFSGWNTQADGSGTAYTEGQTFTMGKTKVTLYAAWTPELSGFTIGGIVSGLTGTGLVLQNNGADDLAVASDGAFTFSTQLVSGASYSVSIKTMPNDTSLTCMITNNTGTVPGKAVSKVLVVCHPVAGAAVPTISDNLVTDMSDETDPPAGWNVIDGGGTRAGTIIQSLSNTRVYRRTDLSIDNQRAIQIEAVVACEAPFADGERGARLWFKFRDAALPTERVYIAEVRFVTVGGIEQLQLVDGVTGAVRATLTQDWAQFGNPLRVRLKRQMVSGTDYLLLQGESSGNIDDPLQPNKLSDGNSQAVELAGNFQVAIGASEIGFGNAVAGNYSSEWHSLHITTAPTYSTVLPYWPATPPAPTLVHDDKGAAGQAVVFYADLGSPPMTVPYLTTDVATLSLVHSGGTSTVSITNPSTANDGLQYTTFSGLATGQTVTGFVTVCDVSGRCRSSSITTVVIP